MPNYYNMFLFVIYLCLHVYMCVLSNTNLPCHAAADAASSQRLRFQKPCIVVLGWVP